MITPHLVAPIDQPDFTQPDFTTCLSLLIQSNV
jgi:hypothetical protein